MSMQADNPRAVAGSNEAPDYAREVLVRLEADYDALTKSVAEIIVEAEKLPADVLDEAAASEYTHVITRMRELKKRIDGIRESEKTPYLSAERAIDQFFFSLEERLEKRKKTDRNGAADNLYDRLHAYNQRRLAEERRQREEAARLAREAEERVRREREEIERQRREAEQKAARARSEATRAEQERLASESAAALAAVREREEQERSNRQEAEANARAKAADLIRERHDSGALNTMRRVGYAEIVDPMALDAVALWPFVPEKAKAQALLAWAKTCQFKREMAGADIGFREETVTR